MVTPSNPHGSISYRTGSWSFWDLRLTFQLIYIQPANIFSKGLWRSPESWLAIQANYNLWHAKKIIGKGVKSTFDPCKTIQDASLNKRRNLKLKNTTEKLKTR